MIGHIMDNLGHCEDEDWRLLFAMTPVVRFVLERPCNVVFTMAPPPCVWLKTLTRNAPDVAYATYRPTHLTAVGSHCSTGTAVPCVGRWQVAGAGGLELSRCVMRYCTTIILLITYSYK